MSKETISVIQIEVLRAFFHGLRQEGHILSGKPEILWQQMYNRIQWSGKEVEKTLRPEFIRRNRPDARPWIKLGTPYKESDTLIFTLARHTKGVTSCAFSSDGHTLASASEDGTVRLWDVNSGEEKKVIINGTSTVAECVFSQNGRIIASAARGVSPSVKLWDVDTGELLNTFEGHLCAFSPDGKRIVTASWDNIIRIWDTNTGDELYTLRGHTERISACSFSPDGRKIISADWSNMLRLWDAVTGNALGAWKGHSKNIFTCAFSPDGSLIASASEDSTLRLWDVEDVEYISYGIMMLLQRMKGYVGDYLNIPERLILEGHDGAISCFAFSPDGNLIVTASYDRTMRVWDVQNGQTLSILEGHTDHVTSCDFSPAGRMVASTSDDKTVKIWDFTKNQQYRDRKIQKLNGQVLNFSPDGRLITIASSSALILWDYTTQQKYHSLEGHSKNVTDCAFSSNGDLIVTASADNTLMLWDVATGQRIRSFVGHVGSRIPGLRHFKGQVKAVEFSPDDCWIVSAGTDNTLKVWDVETGKDLRTLRGHQLGVSTGPSSTFSIGVNACQFSPDGSLIVSGGKDGKVKIWNSATGKELQTLEGHTKWVNRCKFSPDGRKIVSASSDKTIKVWDVLSAQVLITFEGHTEEVSDFIISPDANYIISSSFDKTVKVWRLDDGEMINLLPLSGSIHSIVLHPWNKQVFCTLGDDTIYQMEIMGLEFGPSIITAVEYGKDLTVNCPICNRTSPIVVDQLDSVISCPQPDCNHELRINPFVTKIT